MGLASEQRKASKGPPAVEPAAPPSRTDQAEQEERWVEDDGAQERVEDDGAGEWAEETEEEPRPAKKAGPPAYYTWLAALVGAALVWVFQALRR